MARGGQLTTKRPAKDRFPAILEDAFHDPENCPLDSAAKVALSDDREEYTWALFLLRNMSEFGRQDARVFLLGLLISRGRRVNTQRTRYSIKARQCGQTRMPGDTMQAIQPNHLN